MKAEIISIGDELLIGQVVNTNASWLGEQFSLSGIQIRRISTIGDDRDDILAAFDRACSEHDIVLVTGGLGPTHDDITREAVCSYFNTSLTFSQIALDDIEAMFRERKRALSDVNRDQAMVPASARIIRNLNGTAPGYHFIKDGTHFFVTPGVPYEMHAMVENDILPTLRRSLDSMHESITLLTTGIPESALSEMLNGVAELEDCVGVAFLPSPMGVRIRLTAGGMRSADCHDALKRVEDFVREHAAEYLFGSGKQTLEEVVGHLLQQRSLQLSVSESCTGGVITDKLTNISGSSSWFERGAVTYSNESKVDFLGVPNDTLAVHGAVSRETAVAMAEGIRLRTGCDIGLSTTGIAGPTGATPGKPVGLVWIGLSTSAVSFAHPYYFGNDRIRTKQRAAQAALDMLRRDLLSLPPVPTILTETP